MKPAHLTPVLCTLALGACSSGGAGLSTSSIFGGSAAPTVAQAPPVPVSDPTTRAFQVGTVSARAVKCGYNFDPANLRASFLASEVGLGAAPADLAKTEKIYDVAYNGVTKAVTGQADYCSPERTKDIKASLNRHLAGDFSPVPVKIAVPDQGGIFSGLWGDGSSSSDTFKVQKPSTANDY